MTGTRRPTAENWSCGFEPDPGVWACLEPAVWHGFRLTDDGTAIASMMASCDSHKPRMARRADYVHPMASPCGIPGSRFVWPENHCYTEWDERELTAEALAVMAG